MAKTTTTPFTQTLQNFAALFLNADTAQSIDNSGVVSNNKALFTAGAEGSVVKALRIASNDTAAAYLTFWIQPGGTGTVYALGTVAVAITAGIHATAATPNVDCLANGAIAGLTLDQSNRPVLLLSAGTKLSVGIVTACTSNKAIYVTGEAEDF